MVVETEDVRLSDEPKEVGRLSFAARHKKEMRHLEKNGTAAGGGGGTLTLGFKEVGAPDLSIPSMLFIPEERRFSPPPASCARLNA